MANAFYQNGAEFLLNGQINWTEDNVAFGFLAATYSPDLNNHRFLSDVAAFFTLGHYITSGKTGTVGVADGTYTTSISIVAGPSIAYVIVYKDTGMYSTSPLIALFDTATGLPFTPDGSQVNVTYSGAGWFQI